MSRKPKQPSSDGQPLRWYEVVAEGCPRMELRAASELEAVLEYKSRLRIQSPTVEPRVTLME